MRLATLVVFTLFGAVGIHAFDQPFRGTVAPRSISKTEPQYTKAATEARIEGDVRLSALISEMGIPTEIQVTKSLDPGLDQNAIRCAEGWRFKAGTRDSKPVAVRVTLVVSFRLRAR